MISGVGDRMDPALLGRQGTLRIQGRNSQSWGLSSGWEGNSRGRHPEVVREKPSALCVHQEEKTGGGVISSAILRQASWMCSDPFSWWTGAGQAIMKAVNSNKLNSETLKLLSKTAGSNLSLYMYDNITATEGEKIIRARVLLDYLSHISHCMDVNIKVLSKVTCPHS